MRPLYQSCPLPTHNDFDAPNAVHVDPALYSVTNHRNGERHSSCFIQKAYRRAGASDAPRPDLVAPFAPAAPTAEGGESKRKVGRRKREVQGQLRSYAVRMIPTAEQKRELKRCFAASRHAYNWTVAEMERRRGEARAAKDRGEVPEKYWSTEFSLRKAYTASNARPDWTRGVHSGFTTSGVAQAAKAYTSNWGKQKVDPSHRFEVRFRSHRRTKTESLDVRSGGGDNSELRWLRPVPCASNTTLRDECLAFFGMDLGTCGGIRLQDKGHVIQKLLTCNGGKAPPECCRILWDKRTDNWHFKFVYDLPALHDPDPRFETKRVAATDPGVRRFQTYYCPATGEFGELFRKGRRDIERRCVALDDLASRIGNVVNVLEDKDAPPSAEERRRAHRSLRSLRRRSARGRRRLRGFVECGHYAAARFLLDRHEVVVAPKLQTADLANTETRVMGSSSVRAMLTFSHYKFQQRLESAAFRFPGRIVVSDGGEPGTSRTCTHCGHWYGDLGGSKFFCCPACGLEMNRDVAGARNNFFAAWQKHATEKAKEERAQRRKRPVDIADSSEVSESTASSPSGGEEGVTLSPQRP